MTCGIRASWRSTAARMCGMVIAVTGRPPRGDAVDQFAPVGQHDAAAMRCRDRKRRACGLHLRIGQPDVVEAGRIPIRCAVSPIPLFSLVLPDIRRFHGTLRSAIVPVGLAEVTFVHCSVHAAKIACARSMNLPARNSTALERASLRRTPGGHGARRHLGRARRPASAVVFLQRLPQSQPAPRRHRGRDRGDRTLRRRRRRVAAGDRQSSALCGARKPAGAAQGHRGGLRVRLRLSRQYRHHPGAGRAGRSDPGR